MDTMEPKIICFHGTSKRNAHQILETGFRPGTFFAKHLEDALEFGGAYVFSVCFDEKRVPPLPPSRWQFIARVRIPPDSIVRLRHYGKIENLFENSDLGDLVFESNEMEDEE